MHTNEGLEAMIEAEVAKIVVDPSLEGKTLGKYRFASKIGGGGMGTVYLAEETHTRRTVVIKVVKFPSQEPEHRKMMITRFCREAQAACKVLHPNVAVTFSFDEIDGRLLLVMEHIVGRTLRDEIVARPMAHDKAIEIVIGILKGLEAIHAEKIVHRDLKPGNVMLTQKDDQVKILDFGLVKATETFGDVALDATLTQVGMPPGSPLYMSPEQTRSLPVTASTDIYSVGVILFQALAGQAPFRGQDAVEIYDKHRNAPVPPIVSPLGPIHPGLDAIVRKAMAKQPGNRYESATAMREALEAVMADMRKKKRAFLPWIAGAVAVCTAAALIVGLVLTPGVSSDQSRPKPVVQSTRAEAPAPSKAVAEVKASGGFEIPPPPPPASSVAQGCKLYTAGQTTEAIATLTRALAAKPNDADGLFCLCGSYAREPQFDADALKTCRAYLARPDKDANKANQARLWIRRIKQ